MITPYPPPAARVELLRVRRIDPVITVERSGAAPLRDPGDQPPAYALRYVDRLELSDEALALLARDLAKTEGTASSPITTNPTRS